MKENQDRTAASQEDAGEVIGGALSSILMAARGRKQPIYGERRKPLMMKEEEMRRAFPTG